MNQSTVFPSNAVARWIDTEQLENELEPVSEQTLKNATERSHVMRARGDLLPRAPRLRYRPFERLWLLRLNHG
jgi:hypothetical protein